MSQDPYILANPPKRQPVSDTRTYNVTLQTKITGIEKPVNSTIAYTLEITYSDHFFTFKKTNVIVDGNPIPSKINELYLRATEPLNTVEFRCTEQGMVKDFYKYSKLVKQWEHTKNLVKEEFTGASVDQVIGLLDKTYNNKQTILGRLSTNIVLQTFYRSFLNDYLIYYGKNNTTFTNTGILDNLLLPFKELKTLGLKDEQLYLQTQASLNKEKGDKLQLETHFKNKVKDFSIDDLEINLQDRTLLNYDSVWINQSTATQTIQAGNYKKEIVLTLQHV